MIYSNSFNKFKIILITKQKNIILFFSWPFFEQTASIFKPWFLLNIEISNNLIIYFYTNNLIIDLSCNYYKDRVDLSFESVS